MMIISGIKLAGSYEQVQVDADPNKNLSVGDLNTGLIELKRTVGTWWRH